MFKAQTFHQNDESIHRSHLIFQINGPDAVAEERRIEQRCSGCEILLRLVQNHIGSETIIASEERTFEIAKCKLRHSRAEILIKQTLKGHWVRNELAEIF